MRWGALLLVCIAAACGGTGLDIDVYVPDGVRVTRVELWIAYYQCGSECPNGIAWTRIDRVPGDILFLADEKVIEAKADGDHYVLHLDAEPGYNTPHSITFVGFDGDNVTAVKVLRDTRIPVSHVKIWHVYLDPAGPVTTDQVTPPADPRIDQRAHVWARAPTVEIPRPTGCLVYQAWSGSTWETEFVVPKTDPDCDGFPPEKECNEFWFQYQQDGLCVSDTLLSELPRPCVLGNSPCADGVSNDKTCGHEPGGLVSCVPDVICDKCTGQIPAEPCAADAAKDAHVANTLFHYDCEADAAADGFNCIDQHSEVQLPYSNRICGTVSLHYGDKPFSEGQPALIYGSPPTNVRFTAVLRNITGSPCLVDIYWIGNAAAFKDGVLFFLEIGYDNMTRAFYPIEYKKSNITLSCTRSRCARGSTKPTAACRTSGTASRTSRDLRSSCGAASSSRTCCVARRELARRA
jgi:hypothetical protein